MSISDTPYPTVGLQELVHRAWLDLKQARQDVDLDAMMLAERRMNAFLDKLAVKLAPRGAPPQVSRHPSATVRGRV